MKIGYDVSQTCSSKSGTGFYADQLIRAIAKQDMGNEYYLLPRFYDYIQGEDERATTVEQQNFKNVVVQEFSDKDEFFGSLDIVHSNNFRYPKDIQAKKVVTIYDVSFMDRPEFTTEANRMFCFRGTFDSVMNADIIVAISEYTKERIKYYFPYINDDRIRVVHGGNRYTLLGEKENVETIMEYGLTSGEYFLGVGTIEPRKNYETLLKAYRDYKESNRNGYKKLCIAGGYGWMEENFSAKIKKYGIENDVVITGYVSDNVLANLYRYCYAYVYTTWYEGFGLPVLEAMNFAKPIIASNVTSVPEVAGEAAILKNPENYGEFASAMDELARDESLYDKMCGLSAERAKVFSWDNAAEKMISIYNELGAK